jgi:inner membrane protein involved in colicin E2 resistance
VVKHVAAVTAVFVVATLGWMVLGTTVMVRTEGSDRELKGKVGQLWGEPLTQAAPSASLRVPTTAEREEWSSDRTTRHVVVEKAVRSIPVPLAASEVDVDLDLDQRRKGLLWYATYRVRFSGSYTFEVPAGHDGELHIALELPSPTGIYDDFRLTLNGAPTPFARDGSSRVEVTLPAASAGPHTLAVGYASQGLDRFAYRFGDGVTQVRQLRLTVTTDFSGFDFPDGTMSPTEQERTGDGARLTWRYADLITGSGVGIEMPKRLNPGPTAARISFFAPVSLGFFFFLVMVVAVLKGVRIHAVNYFFLACAFFAFHLLLAYLVDHVSLPLAFALCSAVSVALVVSYMRVVVGPRFAFVEVALAQLVYLVGFSAAFFVAGFTGLTVTVGAIVTLAVVMQLTARVDWGRTGQTHDCGRAPG